MVYGFQKQWEKQLDPKAALLFNSKKSKDHLKKHALQRDPARGASFKDKHYFLHIPLLFTKLDLYAFSTAVFLETAGGRKDTAHPALPMNSPNHSSFAISLGLQQNYV